MRSKELPPQLRDRFTQRHRCGEGGKKKLFSCLPHVNSHPE